MSTLSPRGTLATIQSMGTRLGFISCVRRYAKPSPPGIERIAQPGLFTYDQNGATTLPIYILLGQRRHGESKEAGVMPTVTILNTWMHEH